MIKYVRELRRLAEGTKAESNERDDMEDVTWWDGYLRALDDVDRGLAAVTLNTVGVPDHFREKDRRVAARMHREADHLHQEADHLRKAAEDFSREC